MVERGGWTKEVNKRASHIHSKLPFKIAQEDNMKTKLSKAQRGFITTPSFSKAGGKATSCPVNLVVEQSPH